MRFPKGRKGTEHVRIGIHTRRPPPSIQLCRMIVALMRSGFSCTFLHHIELHILKTATYGTFLVLLLILLDPAPANGQGQYDIKLEGRALAASCQDCLQKIAEKPREIQYGIQQDDIGNLYFIVTHRSWFDALFDKSGDGLAIDIINKESYDCSLNVPAHTGTLKGELQRPYYLNELKKNIISTENGSLIVQLGRIPEKFRGKEVEFNILFLKNKYLCYYNYFYDLQVYRWDLLDMGIFFDTLTYRTHYDTSITQEQGFSTNRKIMRFTIPFEKDRSEYSPDDIRPLYDSLRITDHDIERITIRAYSSVEGNEQRNIELQQQRAQSIVNALQSFQTAAIGTEIQATENWVDLLNDVSGTPYAYLKDLDKSAIKEKLKDRSVVNDLEPYLSTHRKAIVVLELSRKDRFAGKGTTEIVRMFHSSIEDGNMEQAIALQNSLFERVRHHEVPVETLEDLKIPKKQEYSLLLTKNSMFKYMMNEKDVYAAYKELEELNDLIPGNAPIAYNLCALKFKIWMLGESAVDPKEFKQQILDLRRLGIAKELVDRMLVNYEIIMSEYHMFHGEFAKKDKSLNFIRTNLRYIANSDMDLLSMAQYFASYAKYEWAIEMLEDKVRSIEVEDDLLFYYLNLTIIDEQQTERSEYRTIMLNAYNKDRERYCRIFDTYGTGGVTFQLLDNAYLRRSYCENCN